MCPNSTQDSIQTLTGGMWHCIGVTFMTVGGRAKQRIVSKGRIGKWGV